MAMQLHGQRPHPRLPRKRNRVGGLSAWLERHRAVVRAVRLGGSMSSGGSSSRRVDHIGAPTRRRLYQRRPSVRLLGARLDLPVPARVCRLGGLHGAGALEQHFRGPKDLQGEGGRRPRQVDATPAERRWRVDTTGPRITIFGAPVRRTRAGVAKVRLRCRRSEPSGPCFRRLRLATGAASGSAPSASS
jgi:hypothetical protein